MITVSKDQKPLPHFFYGDNFERGLDPYHKDAAPDNFKNSRFFSGGERKEGWFLLDNWGNQISFIADGTVQEDASERSKKKGRSNV
jgi:hypothetical protein